MKLPLEWLEEFVTVRLAPEALAERLTMAGLEAVVVETAEGQPVLDLEITPNRADCLSVIGLAREVAAITGQRLKPLVVQGSGFRVQGKSARPRTSNLEPRTPLRIRIEDRQGCRRYIGRLIDGVRIGPSVDWMQRRLIACGARPINNVVDITNYVLLEHGQPLHAFDFSRLAEGMILVRRAALQEPITTLDGVARKLSQHMLVIADAGRPVAVAGVMGGVGSEVTPATRSVLLESALFDPLSVRRTARALGVASESSYRFERGVDPEGVERASVRAAELISQLAGGTVRQVGDAGAQPSARATIPLEVDRANRWLGTRLTPSAMRTALARLSCRVASSGTGGTMRVSVPSFRRDLVREVDLYEELARAEGYDRIPARRPSGAFAVSTGRAEGEARFRRLQSLRGLCASLGLTEAITWSLVSETELARCGVAAGAVRLANPISQDHAYLRPSLLMGLLQVVRRNLTQGAGGVRVFELGTVTHPEGPAESTRLGIALAGLWLRDWHTKNSADFFRLKGLLEALARRLCHGTIRLAASTHAWAEPTRSAVVWWSPTGSARGPGTPAPMGATSRPPESLCATMRPTAEGCGPMPGLGERDIGVAAQVSRAITEALDLEAPVWFAELSVDGLLAAERSTASVGAPPVFPPAKRDLSVVLDDPTPFEAVQQTIVEVGRPLASRVELIDRYVGRQIPQGKHSLTFSIEYREPSRTLTAEEVDAVHQRISQSLVSRFGATLR